MKLRPVARTAGGYGLFDAEALQRLCFVRAALEAGIGLDLLTRLCRALDAADGDEASARLADLCELIEAVAFHRLDRRLAELLLGHGRVMRVTHQELAMRLGSSREIVSRLPSRFAREGWVRSGRESIEVVDPVALRGLAAGGDAA